LKKKIPLSFLTALLITAGSAAAPARSDRLTVEKLYSPELTTGLRTPVTSWLASGRVLLYDVRVDADERTIEVFDPETKVRKPAFGRETFLTGLRKILGNGAPGAVFWPSGIHPSGDILLYEIGGDILCWDVARAAWQRLTSTEDAETSAALSPDGLRVGFIRGSDLFAIERSSGREVRLTQGGSETLLNGPLSWVYWEEIYEHTQVPYAWSPDSRAIAYLQTDDAGVSQSTYVNFEPATQGVVRQRYPKAGQANPRVRLGVAELDSARTTWIESGDDEYVARFTWLPDGRTVAVQTLNRDQNRLRLFFADRATGKSRLVLEENQPAWINLNNALYIFKDGRRFLWLSERDGYQHLYLYAADGTLIRQLTKGPFMVVSAEGDTGSRNRRLVAVDEEAGLVYFTSNKDSLPERHLYLINLDGTGLERLSREEGIHQSTFSPSMEYYLDAHHSRLTPPELKLYAGGGDPVATITPSSSGVSERYGLGTTELLAYRTGDGIDLTLKMTKPHDFDPSRRYPALVYVYGGPGAQETLNDWPRVLWDDLVAQEGYVAVSVEVRAGQNRSKALETSVHRRAYGMQNVKDILDAVGWLKALPYIDGARLGIWGGSGGGCTTLYTMTHSDIFKAGISLYPVSDWHYYDTIYTERYQDTPQDNPEGYAETSSVLAAKDLHGKLLIVHGTHDDNVHPQNTEAFIHELIAAGIPFEMMIYPWQKHGIGARPDQLHLWKLMLDFWKRNI
jgi:dipeptidyl-peptidase-4